MSEIPFEAPSIESIATLLPAFEFEALIAQGGMGAVYKARQRSLDRNVAIKILPRELGDDPLFRTSFVAEAKAMARLIHPNLTGVFDSGDVDGLLYIVMEYVDGKSLHYSAHQKIIDPHQAVEIVIGICGGIGAAHENGIVHRDIKPANILLNQKREPKIGDFGLARAAGHDSDGLAMGTPGYTAPEAITQPELADQRSDIFSVGVILQELLTGLTPHENPDSADKVSDSGLLAICQKATHEDPSQRYQDAASMINDLKSWHQPTSATPAKAKRPKLSPTSGRAHVDNSASSALGRNIAIIIALLITISVAWHLLQKKKAVTAAAAAKEVVEKKPVAQKPKDTPPPPPSKQVVPKSTKTPPIVIDEPPAETPAQSLIRLRPDLANGNFSELPVGTLTKGDSYYFFVSKSASWAEASRMARAYGGHLPLVKDEALLTWMEESIPAGSTNDAIWLGAMRSSPELWQLVSGSPWPLESPPEGSGAFVSVDTDGKVHADSSSDSHPFFIQWQRDGSNPTNIKAILQRCKEAQSNGQAIFPPGTEIHGDRRFLIIKDPGSYIEALEMARLGGADLMTAASEEEADWIKGRIEGIKAPKGLWLGATLQDDLWIWNSHQAWSFGRWSPASKPNSGNALIIRPKKGWAAANQDSEASGFVIEWSDDLQTGSLPAVNKDLDELADKAKGLLAGMEATRGKTTTKNSEEYLWKLDVWLKRRRNKSEVTRWTPLVQRVKATVKNGRLPTDIPRSAGGIYPQPILDIAQFHFRKQQVIDLEFTTKAEKIRDAYVSRLKEAAKASHDLGQREDAQAISDQVNAASDIDAWVASITGQAIDAEEPTVVEDSSGLIIVSATYGTEENSIDITRRITEVLAKGAKRFEVGTHVLRIDPVPGVTKDLTIKFTFNGIAGTKTWKSGETVEAFELRPE